MNTIKDLSTLLISFEWLSYWTQVETMNVYFYQMKIPYLHNYRAIMFFYPCFFLTIEYGVQYSIEKIKQLILLVNLLPFATASIV